MIDLNKIDSIVAEKGTTKEALIPILQAIQREFNYLPEEALRRVSDSTSIKPAEITGVASFYSQFRLAPVGEHMIRVCVGTACHVKGAGQVYDAMRREFKLKEGGSETALVDFAIHTIVFNDQYSPHSPGPSFSMGSKQA